jgi:ABC-2 type transport system permease protein
MLAGAAQISLTRDVGSGLLPARDSAEPRLRGLSSPAALALRSERGSLAAWVLGTAFFALVIGLVSTSVRSTEISSSLQHQLHRLAAVSITTPSGYIGLCFLFFVLAVSLFCCAQIASVRREESEQRLDTVLSMEVDRIRWLAGRLVLAAAGAGALSLGAGLGAWAGADAQGAGIPLPDMVEAGLNCLPAALLFLGLAALAFAAVPRHGLALSYSLVAIAFVWDLLGSLLGAPSWLVQATPFAHIGLAPAQPVRATAAAVMLAAALAACAAAAALFRRRDLVSG